MKALAAAVALLVLSGCATTQPGDPITVRVPVPVPCDPPAVQRPAMPVDSLAPGSDVFQVARAHWAEREIREGYETQLRAAVDGCRGGGASK